jgi:hypothetical protein
MDCATVNVSVDDYCTVLSCTYPKARKQHTCGECRRKILSGEMYERQAIVYDGSVTTGETAWTVSLSGTFSF